MIYAVIDTNIFVSALITHNSNASTVKVLESMFMNRFTPLYNEEIIEEYEVYYIEENSNLQRTKYEQSLIT